MALIYSKSATLNDELATWNSSLPFIYDRETLGGY